MARPPAKREAYRHRVTLQTQTLTRDDYGGSTESWADTATVWARVEPLRGKEYYSGAERQADVSHRITMRHRSGVTPKMRVSYDSRTFAIEAVLNVEERDRELELMCREEVT